MSSDRAWRRWGETDPYFGVLADPRFRRDAFAENEADFWFSGRAYVAHELDRAERHFGPFARRRALDFGCGVGRLTLPLATHFEHVLGLDIAPAMLAEARRRTAQDAAANIDLQLSDDALSAVQGGFDLVMSCIVLQHIPVRRGMGIIRRLLDHVSPGGIAALHVCVDRHDRSIQSLNYWVQRHVPGVHRLTNIMRGRSADEPPMQMNAYPLARILELGQSLGFGAALVDTDAHGRFTTARFLMRRRDDLGV